MTKLSNTRLNKIKLQNGQWAQSFILNQYKARKV
uniref:Uncharacterized protein n=1 Tax=Rhizophora mucronata TaxID=61149 RepID=A0A2P2IHF0_RHIMU